jgi:hypothetical protein
MIIKHFEINPPEIDVPEDCKPCWYGLYRLKACYSDMAWKRFKDAEKLSHEMGYMGERELEVDLFLSILQDIKSRSVTFVELGAGYADWCLAITE